MNTMIALLVNVAVSLLTKAPDESLVRIFDEVNAK